MGILDAPSYSRTASDAKYVGKPATRTGHFFLNAPISTSSVAVFDATYRTLARLGVATGRWRIGFANRNLRSNTTLTTPCTITGVYVGDPVYGTTTAAGARWTGAATGALTSVSGSITVPVNGTIGWSSWITGASSQFSPFTEKVISWGHSNPASGNGLGYISTSYQAYTVAGNGHAGDAVLSGGALTNQILLDIVIEYEYANTGQIGLFIGDSNTFGVATSAPPLFSSAGTGSLPHEAWPNVAGEIAGFSAINYGVGSALLVDFDSAYPGLWTRIDLTAITIDFAVVSLGTNGLSGAAANFDFYTSYIRSINAKLRTYGIKRIYWTDITPRGLTNQATTLSASTTAGATTFTTPVQLNWDDGSAGLIIGSGTDAEFLTVSSTTPTGSGPYTYTVAAAGTLALAHTAGDVVTSSRETCRRRLNAWLRNMPDGISGVIPLERAFEVAPLSASADPRLVCTDALHFVRGAGMQRAAQAVIAGVQPKIS